MKNNEKPLKILSLQFYCFPDEMGGAWKLTYEVNKRLVEKGHKVVQIACKPDDSLADFEVIDGIEYYRIGAKECKSFISLIKEVRRVSEKIIAKYKIDLIHIHNPLVDFACLFNSKLWRIPRVYHFHSLWFDEEKINSLGFQNYNKVPFFDFRLRAKLWLIKIIEWTCFLVSKRFVFLSSYTKRRFQSFFPFKKSKLNVIPGGVDLETFKPGVTGLSQDECHKRLGVPKGAKVFLTVRRLESRMGLQNLIDACYLVNQRNPKLLFYLAIVGAGSLKSDLHDQIEKYGMGEKIKLAGRVPDLDIAYYYGAADLFVLPTLAIEGFGLATVEALASGIPVFGTPVGGTTEILRNIDPKLLFEDSSPESMAKLLQGFLENSEPTLALKENCRKEAEEKYDWNLSVNHLEKLFYEVLEG
jgi:glycosyltransferase involved in cell wall biosynthesis